MKLRGTKLAAATKKALEERRAAELKQAEARVASKVNELMDRIEHEDKHIDRISKELEAVSKRRDELAKRVEDLKAGKPEAMDEPKGPHQVIDWAATDRTLTQHISRKYRVF